MKKQLLFLSFLIFNFHLINAQYQIGQDIVGEAAWDQLGNTTAISANGTRIVLGSNRYSGAGIFYGQVKIYDYNGTSWEQVGNEILGTHNYNGIGAIVSISADGSLVAFSTKNSSDTPGQLTNLKEVFVYELNGNDWIQKGQKIRENNFSDLFGNALSISDDGNRLAIGADKRAVGASGVPYVEIYEFEKESDSWIQIGQTLEGKLNSAFGGSVSLSSDGSILAIGVPSDNHTNVYQFNNDTWSLMGQELFGESGVGRLFGTSVSLSNDGQKLAIGDHTNSANGSLAGHVRVFNYDANGTWSQYGNDIDGENAQDISGTSISLAGDGNTVAIGAYRNGGNGNEAGHARVYKFANNDWQQVFLDIDGDNIEDELGFSVSLSDDGNSLLVGARNNDSNGTNAGLARVYSFVENINTDANLLLDYPFNGNTDDISGNQYHGENFGATYTNDRFGNENSAILFDGIDDYVNFPNITTLKPNLPVSFAFWIRYDSDEVEGRDLFSTSFEEDVNTGIYFTSQASTGNYAIGFGDGSTYYSVASRRSFVANETIDTGEWHHIAISVNASLDMKIYEDCKLIDGTYSGSGGSLQYSIVPGTIGRHDRNLNELANYFKGAIDDFKYWDREITIDDISELCNNTLSTTDFQIDESTTIVYPNPTKDLINIKFSSLDKTADYIYIYNAIGQLVYKNIFSPSINISNLKTGIYYLNLVNKTTIETKKIIIK